MKNMNHFFLNEETKNHTKRVVEIAKDFINYLVSENELELTMKEYFLKLYAYKHHDDAKALKEIKSLIEAPRMLTPEERTVVNTHAVKSSELVVGNDFVKFIIANHHTAANTMGHSTVEKLAKILSIVDCFEALTAERAYKKAFSIEKTAEILFGDAEKGKLDMYFLNTFFAFKGIETSQKIGA